MAVTAEADDTENTVTQVEFFVDGESIGVDDTAPYEATWNPTADNYYELTAVATNDKGLYTRSRVVLAQVGDLFAGMKTFTNANGTFEQLAEGKYLVTSGGANMWQGTNEYSTIYREQGADENWSATVKINSQGNSNGSAKAGIIVRNDVTQTANSQGYAALGMRPSGGFSGCAATPAGSSRRRPARARRATPRGCGSCATATCTRPPGARTARTSRRSASRRPCRVRRPSRTWVSSSRRTARRRRARSSSRTSCSTTTRRPRSPAAGTRRSASRTRPTSSTATRSTRDGRSSARPTASRSPSPTATPSCRSCRATSTRRRPGRSATSVSPRPPGRGRSRPSSTSRSPGTGSTPASWST